MAANELTIRFPTPQPQTPEDSFFVDVAIARHHDRFPTEIDVAELSTGDLRNIVAVARALKLVSGVTQ